MLEEEHGVVAPQRMREEPLGVAGRRGHRHPEARHLRKHAVVAAGVVRGGRVADADAAPQHDRHLQPAARHELHLGDLVDDLAPAIEHKIDEHEIDHGLRAGHRRAAGQAREAPLADRRVTQPVSAILREEPRSGAEVAAAGADPLAEHEDAVVGCHLRIERLDRGLDERELPRGRVGRWLGHDPGRLGVDMRRGGGRRGRRRRLGGRAALRHEFLHLGLDRVEFLTREAMVLFEPRAEGGDRTACLPGIHLVAGAVVEVSHPLGVGPGAVGLAFDQRGALACAGAGHRAGRRLAHRHDVVAVDLLARQAVIGGATAHIGDAAGLAEGHLRRELVVLADEKHWQLPDGGHVEPLVEGAVVDGAVAEEGHRHAAGVLLGITVSGELEGVAAARGLEDARAHDAARAEHADLGREEVHAAAAAAGAAGRPAEELGDEVARRHALGKRVAVAAVRAEDDVGGSEVAADTGSDRLLAHVSMAGAVDQAPLVATGELFFGVPDDEHRAVEPGHMRTGLLRSRRPALR